jgi:hypothetical protein
MGGFLPFRFKAQIGKSGRSATAKMCRKLNKDLNPINEDQIAVHSE